MCSIRVVSKQMKTSLFKPKRTASLESNMARKGYLFILPWLIGFLLFFVYPMFMSVWYSFSNSTPIDDVNGNIFAYLGDKFVGLKYYDYIWLRDTDFTNNLSNSLWEFFYSLPIIIFLSLVFALVLNQKFRGRLIARAIFFIPVIVASGVVMSYLNGDTNAQELLNSPDGNNTMYTSVSFSEMLMNMGLPKAITEQLNSYISSIFSLVWSSGVQTILFLAGLQAISAQYYEVADVEGATKWETFWFITFPMLMNVTILNVVYTAITIFTDNKNAVMQQAYELIFTNINYNKSAAIMWSYFAILGIIIGLAFLIFRKLIQKNTY